MATDIVQAGTAPANGALAPDAILQFSLDMQSRLYSVEALFEAVDQALDGATTREPLTMRQLSMVGSFVRLGLAECERAATELQALEVSSRAYSREG